jgi:nucleoside-diphosphate-sugar epimerase
MKALITGGTGFIGSHLVGALARSGFFVRCLIRHSSDLRYISDINVRKVIGDCTDLESLYNAVKGADYVFHLAGLTKASKDEDYYNANVKGTENIINAVLKVNPYIKRFVYLSSLAAAGPSIDGSALTEDSEPMPVSSYGRTKLEGERIVLKHKRDIPITVIRPPAVYGPRDKDLLVFFKLVNSGFAPYWGKSYYSFIYVEDLINGIILSALNDSAIGEIFFISDSNIYSNDDIIKAIANAVMKKPIKIYIPGFLMTALGFLSQRISGVNIINPDKIKEIKYPYWICDTKKIKSLLNYEPMVKIDEGFKQTVQWYKINKWLQ